MTFFKNLCKLLNLLLVPLTIVFTRTMSEYTDRCLLTPTHVFDVLSTTVPRLVGVKSLDEN